MKTLVVMTSLALGALASNAIAADFSIKGNANETLEASDNYFLTNAPAGATVKSTTAGTLDFLARTPTTSYLLDANYSYYKYLGPGAADAGGLTWGTPASATFTTNHTTELAKFNLGASWSRADAATTQLTQSGISTLHGSTNTYSANGGVNYELGRLDSISWTAQASTVSFTDPTSTPYTDYTSALSWNHTLSSTTSLNNSVNFDWFSQDDPAKSQRLFWSITTGLQTQLTPRLTLNAGGGIDLVNSYQTGVAQATNPTGAFQPLVGAGTGWVANVGLNYKLLKTTGLSLTAANAIIPTLGGALQQSYTFGLGVNHDINALSKLSFGASFAMTNASNQFSQIAAASGGGASDFFSASVNYQYQLTREWRTNLSYTYRQRNDDTGIARSNTILLAVSRDFTVLGNPAGIDKAAAERAKQRAQQSVGQVFPGFQ